MGKDFPRTRRVADQIQRELADIVRLELKDPRVGMITLTGVEVTTDYAHAKVFFTLLGDAARAEEAATGLRRAAGFLRTQLAHRLKFRTVPQLQFVYDTSVERGMNLSRLIDEAVGHKPPTDE
jgi:ribosome-binding factor A